MTLPVAISFLTFHAISYIVDVYRGRLKASRSPLDILLYISFFPHLVAGPIVRAHEFLPQLASPRRAEDFGFGENMLLILGGLFKKMVIANYLAVKFVDPIFTDPTQFSRFDLVMAVYAYAIQIYADFSAYTDIAIGVAALLGYRFPQNFNQPYRALGIGDFWRRWHMTLSNWLRDYLYIPLGGNRGGRLMTARNLMLTMLLGGLWHGANWTFLIWGALHGAALVVDHAYRRSAALCALWPTAVGGGARLDRHLPFRLPVLAVLPRPLARRGDAISGRHFQRQRRGFDHAGDRLAAARRRRVHASHPAGLAPSPRRMARRARPVGAGARPARRRCI